MSQDCGCLMMSGGLEGEGKPGTSKWRYGLCNLPLTLQQFSESLQHLHSHSALGLALPPPTLSLLTNSAQYWLCFTSPSATGVESQMAPDLCFPTLTSLLLYHLA